MKRIRCAGLVEIENKFAFMHRTGVKPSLDDPNKPSGEYYVFPGGGLEGEESMYEAVEREIFEELGIKVKAKKELYYKEVSEDLDEYVFLCEYISGKFGTGQGPEFSNNPEYKDRGNYFPELISKEQIGKINLIPIEFKEQLVQDLKNNLY